MNQSKESKAWEAHGEDCHDSQRDGIGLAIVFIVGVSFVGGWVCSSLWRAL